MKNNKQYFALQPQPDGMLKKVYPKTIDKSHYDSIDMFCYQVSLSEWHVVEVTTGLPIALSKISKHDALSNSRNEINARGRFAVMAQIDLASKALNQMNIYEEIEE